MCVRYVLASGTKAVEKELLADFCVSFSPFFNAHPGGSWPVVLSETPTTITLAKWGLVPFWSKWNNCNYNHNVFATDLVKNPVYRVPIRMKRCLVPANCYLSWVKKTDEDSSNPINQPHVVYLEGQRIFTMAGLYDTWRNKEDGTLHYSFAIITTNSCKKLRRFTPGMPVILSPSKRSKYLKMDLPLNEIMPMLRPYESDLFRLYPVSKLACHPAINDKRVVQPIGEKM